MEVHFSYMILHNILISSFVLYVGWEADKPLQQKRNNNNI